MNYSKFQHPSMIYPTGVHRINAQNLGDLKSEFHNPICVLFSRSPPAYNSFEIGIWLNSSGFLQLQKLGDLLEKHPKENSSCGSGPNSNSGDRHSDKREIKCGGEYEQKLLVDKGSDVTVIVYTDGGNGKNKDGFRPKETGLQSMAETGDGSLMLPDWSSFEPEYYSDQSCSSLQWWDLWHWMDLITQKHKSHEMFTDLMFKIVVQFSHVYRPQRSSRLFYS